MQITFFLPPSFIGNFLINNYEFGPKANKVYPKIVSCRI